jgi:hypothetical protein
MLQTALAKLVYGNWLVNIVVLDDITEDIHGMFAVHRFQLPFQRLENDSAQAKA